MSITSIFNWFKKILPKEQSIMCQNFKILSFSQQGKRDYQEDSYYANPEMGLFIVCDGVGGAKKRRCCKSVCSE